MNTANNRINKYYQALKQHYPNLNKNTLSPIIICLLGYLFIGLFPPLVSGDTVSNDNYTIDVNNIDTNPQPTPRQQVLGTNNIKIKEFTTGPNYTVSDQNNSLSIELPQNTIDYGILSSTNPVIRTSNIVLTDTLFGGEVISYENHALTANANDIIQNTSCDNGNCTPEIAAVWDNTLTYGFGYRCDTGQENVCDNQFSQSSYFKPYADNSNDHTPEAIMLTGKGKSEAIITYKVNISGTQKTGAYYNSITYLAIPKF